MGQNTAILDIGSSKVICLICSPGDGDSIVVRGAGIREYDGYKDDRFLDEQQFSDAIVDALAMAEGEAKVHIRDLSVGDVYKRQVSGMPCKGGQKALCTSFFAARWQVP